MTEVETVPDHSWIQNSFIGKYLEENPMESFIDTSDEDFQEMLILQLCCN